MSGAGWMGFLGGLAGKAMDVARDQRIHQLQGEVAALQRELREAIKHREEGLRAITTLNQKIDALTLEKRDLEEENVALKEARDELIREVNKLEREAIREDVPDNPYDDEDGNG